MPYQGSIFLTALGFLFLAFSLGISAYSNADDGQQLSKQEVRNLNGKHVLIREQARNLDASTLVHG